MRGRNGTAALVLALLVAACGNSSSGDDQASSTSPSTTRAAATTIPSDEVDYSEHVPVDAPGVTDTEIRVAVISSKTNPFNGKYAELADGINAYFAMVNDAGGMWGRQLKITSERDDIAGTQNLAQVQASLAEDNVFATFLATLDLSGADALDAAGMPTFVWQIVSGSANHDNIFGNEGTLCLGCAGPVLPWLAQQLGVTKVGIVGYGVSNQSKLCAQGNRASFEKYGSAEVAFYDDTLGFAQADLSAQVAQMKAAGVGFVTTCMDINESIVLAKEMKKQGMQVVQHLPNGYDRALVASNAELLEGAVVIPRFVAFEHEPLLPIQEDYLEWMGKIGKEPIVEVAVIGWVLAHQFVEGLKLAGPQFSQQGVIDALNSLTDYDADGMIPPIDWTRQHADPKENPEADARLDCANFTRVRNGALVADLGAPGKPWVCWENNVATLVEPTFMSFAPMDD